MMMNVDEFVWEVKRKFCIDVVQLIEFVYGEGGGMMIEWVYGCEGSDRKEVVVYWCGWCIMNLLKREEQ